MILTLFTVALAAMNNAVMDSISHFYSQTIFSKRGNDQYWNPKKSWTNKYIDNNPLKGRKKIKILGKEFNKHVAFTDGWHKHKSIMIVLLCLLPLVFTIDSKLFEIANCDINIIPLSIVYFILNGLIWNKIFMYYYTKKFKL